MIVTAILSAALLSVGLHLALGWEWTVLAGVVAGLMARRSSGWLLGAGGTGLGWAILVVYSAAVAPASFRILLDTMGALGGNIPGETLVGLTVFLGSLLGALGGGIGSVLRPLVEEHLHPVD
jgi:hypothetical protein